MSVSILKKRKLFKAAVLITVAVLVFGLFSGFAAQSVSLVSAENSAAAAATDTAYDAYALQSEQGYETGDGANAGLFGQNAPSFNAGDLSFDSPSTDADIDSQAEAQAEWDGVSADSLWYYGEEYLRLAELKRIISGWNLSKASQDNPVIIAVIDTGLNTSHEAFEDMLAKTEDGKIRGYNAHNAYGIENGTISYTGESDKQKKLGDITDYASDSHGTAMASVIAMLIRELGLENYIKIYPIKASYTNSNKEVFNIKAVTKAIEWAASETVGASVINLSLGLLKSEMKTTNWSTDKGLNAALKAASQKCVITAAAGNDGKNSASDAFYPAFMDGVLSVMSYGKTKTVYSTSNFGDYDVIAPGEDIYCAKNLSTDKTTGYQYLTGTSLSSSITAAAAAVFKFMFVIGEAESDQGAATVPTANEMSRLIRYENSALISKQVGETTFQFVSLDIVTLLKDGYNREILRYSTPTGIFIDLENASDFGDGKIDEENVLNIRTDEVVPLELSAELTPYGETDPVYDATISWSVIIDGVEKFKSTGKKLIYTPAVGGEYEITASVKPEGSTFTASFSMKVSYVPFISGDVRVTLAEDADLDVSQARSSTRAYTAQKVSFSLTGILYVDRSVEIKWYVNGSYASSGLIFDFIPEKSGSYTVSAVYGDNPLASAHAFDIEVASRAASPLYLFSIITGSVLLIAVSAFTAALEIKRKKTDVRL
jgi:hypothetical protein